MEFSGKIVPCFTWVWGAHSFMNFEPKLQTPIIFYICWQLVTINFLAMTISTILTGASFYWIRIGDVPVLLNCTYSTEGMAHCCAFH